MSRIHSGFGFQPAHIGNRTRPPRQFSRNGITRQVPVRIWTYRPVLRHEFGLPSIEICSRPWRNVHTNARYSEWKLLVQSVPAASTRIQSQVCWWYKRTLCTGACYDSVFPIPARTLARPGYIDWVREGNCLAHTASHTGVTRLLAFALSCR